MKIVIIGGGYAGVACAVRLARKAREAGRRADITLVNRSADFVERIRLHQLAAGQALPRRSLAELLQPAGVRLRIGSVERIDIAGQSVECDGERLHWDRLVLAIGSQAGRLDIAGAAAHARLLQIEQIGAWAARLATLPAGAQVLVVGGGLTGIEAASEIGAAYPHLKLRLLSRGRIAADWSAPARSHLLGSLHRLGVHWHQSVEVGEVRANTLLTTQGRWDFDLCVWAAGFELPALARASGLPVNAAGQLRVDSQLRSIANPAVYAAGDIAAAPPDCPLTMGCKAALPSGAQVADNLARELCGLAPQRFDFALPFHCLSLGRADAVIQWPDAQGRLLGRVVVGAAAAAFKEAVCTTTWQWLVEEAAGIDAIRWARGAVEPTMTADAMPVEVPA